MQPSTAKPHLSLVQAGAETEFAGRWFCGRCGAGPSAGARLTPMGRVCRSCGRGLLLEARTDVAPRRGEPFLVVDSKLTVQAVSRGAEELLALREPDVTDLPVTGLLVAAGTDLASMLARAAAGGEHVPTAIVRPRDTFGVRLPVRIGACGPPRAALIVFESRPAQGPRLRLVNGHP